MPDRASVGIAFSGMSEDEVWVMVDQAFPLGDRGWRDVMSITPEEKRNQAIVDMLTLAGLAWMKQTSAVDTLLAALTFLASIANPVTAIAGGAASLVTLAAALKGL